MLRSRNLWLVAHVGLAFLLWKVITLVALNLGPLFLPMKHAFTYANFEFTLRPLHTQNTLPYWMTAWGNFDAFYYLEIAKRGYNATELPFFPLYPITIALVTRLTTSFPHMLSAYLISHAAFIAGLFVCAKVLTVDKKRPLLPLLLLAVISFPTSYSYGAAYNDSLFFFLATLTIYWSRSSKWWQAGVAGALATLTRFNGLALFPYLIGELVTTRYASVTRTWNVTSLVREGKKLCASWHMDKRLYAILLVPGAFGGYLLYIQLMFGSWSKLFSAMDTWGQDRMVLPLQVLWRYGKIFVYVPLTQLVWWVALVELLAIFFYIALLIWSFKKIRISYWIFFAVSILIPALTGTFQGMPRYGLHLYPLFLSLAMIFEKKSTYATFLYMIVSLILFIFCVILFTRGYFIA